MHAIGKEVSGALLLPSSKKLFVYFKISLWPVKYSFLAQIHGYFFLELEFSLVVSVVNIRKWFSLGDSYKKLDKYFQDCINVKTRYS